MNKKLSEPSNRIATIPNLLCGIRLFGSLVLVGLAVSHRNTEFLWLFIILAMTDWVDGKLAILLNQRSVFGARLDSWADAALYTALLFGGLWMHWDLIASELPWITFAVLTYAVSTAAGLIKFGRWPSYHTRAAKTSWFLVTVGAVVLLAELLRWPFHAAMVAVTVTNLEALLITCRSPRCLSDITSVFHLRTRLAKSLD